MRPCDGYPSSSTLIRSMNLSRLVFLVSRYDYFVASACTIVPRTFVCCDKNGVSLWLADRFRDGAPRATVVQIARDSEGLPLSFPPTSPYSKTRYRMNFTFKVHAHIRNFLRKRCGWSDFVASERGTQRGAKRRKESSRASPSQRMVGKSCPSLRFELHEKRRRPCRAHSAGYLFEARFHLLAIWWNHELKNHVFAFDLFEGRFTHLSLAL